MLLLQEHYSKNPKKITELEVQEYLLYRKKTSKWAESTLNTTLCGIRYYYQMMLNVNWELFRIAKFARENKLPTVLTKEEVDKLLRCVRPFNNYVYLVLVYSCGLRLSEALNIEVSDIDRGRMVIHIHRGKGAKDRLVPLPHSTLKLLGRYWLTHKHPRFLFPRTQTNKQWAPVNDLAEDTVNKGCAQHAMRQAVKKAKINKKGVSVHTLRQYVEYRNMGSNNSFLSYISIFSSYHSPYYLVQQRLFNHSIKLSSSSHFGKLLGKRSEYVDSKAIRFFSVSALAYTSVVVT